MPGTLRSALCSAVFDRASHAAEEIQRVADVHADVVERERRRTRGAAGRRNAIELRDVAARGAGFCVDAGEQRAACGVGIFLGLAQGGLSRRDAGTMRERLPDTTVQFVAGELRPPLFGHIGAFEEPLRIAGRYAGRRGRRRQRVLAVGIDCRR